VTRIKSTPWILACLALISFLLVAGSGCAQQAAPTPTPAATPTSEAISEVAEIAKKIKSGEIDVGEVFGMATGERYHNIHATELNLDCTTCHVSTMTTGERVFSAQDVSSQAPGPVNREACLQCHETGPATNLYGGESSKSQ
jgi:hypothetical protein